MYLIIILALTVVLAKTTIKVNILYYKYSLIAAVVYATHNQS